MICTLPHLLVISLNNGLSSYICQSGSQIGIVNQLNIRLSRKLLIINGMPCKRGGNLHNKLISSSGTKKYKIKKTKNNKLNWLALEFLILSNILVYYHLPNITFITFEGSKDPTFLLLSFLSITVKIFLLLSIDSAKVSIIASLETSLELELFES